jgi:cell division protein FtsB
VTKHRLVKELFIMAIICFASYHALKSIYGSVERQIFLYDQIQSLKTAQKQALEANKDLANGLSNYKSEAGLERLARERLNLVGKDEIMVRIGK